MSRPVLARGSHDRAAHRRGDEAWLAKAWEAGLVLPVTADYLVPVREDGDRPRLDWRPSPSVAADAERLFLGEVDGQAYFAVHAERDLETGSWSGLRELGAALDDTDAGLLVESIALLRWHERHLCCSICGARTKRVLGGWSTRCTVDGSEHWPRTDPAVIMLVHDGGDRCVLGRQASWPAGRFSILAGFVEPGESLEAAVAREVAEEVGLTVTDVRYVASQPWPFPSSLMLGFTARAVGDLAIHRADDELAEAHWASRDEIRERFGSDRLPPPVSIAYQIITGWLEGRLPA